ncbi:hypothetical protein [Polaribacter sp. SA4-10]|uniref:hypothetical protein n=1 Tax=Polaribacter sp. SA4-10 TaxID=754397 RepID=UPI0026CF736E
MYEYRGVLTHNKQEIFIKGPFKNGANNIGEFLTLIYGITLLKSKNKEDIPIYSDSRIAMSWVKKKLVEQISLLIILIKTY